MAVLWNEPDSANNYKQIIEDFIRLHGRGEVAVTNVVGILFYILAKRPDITLEQLGDYFAQVEGVDISKVERVLQ